MENIISKQDSLQSTETSIGVIKLTLIALVFFFEAILFQWVNGALDNEYTGFPDEAAHYVSSLLVSDYIVNGELEHPLYYAKEYYYHYPKVAIGHWPPVMYGLLGLWLIIFGTSRISAMCFMAATTAALATTVYYIGKKHLNKFSALFAPLLLISIPLIQEMGSVVMLEQMVTLLTVISSVFLASFLTTGRAIPGILFALFAATAILTRGTAWSIGLMPIIIMIIAWRFEMLKKPILWVSACIVLVLCLPWYIAMPSVNAGAFSGGSLFSMEYSLHAAPWFAMSTYLEIGFAITLLFILGVWAKIITPIISNEKMELIWPTLLAIVLSIYIMHVVIPADEAIRYMTTGIPSIILFAFAGLEWVLNKINLNKQSPIIYSVLLAAYIVPQLNNSNQSTEGYVPAYNAAIKQIDSNQKSVLIASDVFGEGSVIAHASSQDDGLNNAVLRASKLLVSEDWIGRGTVNKYKNKQDLANILSEIPVDAIIIDKAVSDFRKRNYHSDLESLMQSDIENWQLVEKSTLIKKGITHEEGLLVYVSKNISKKKRIKIGIVKNIYEKPSIIEQDKGSDIEE